MHRSFASLDWITTLARSQRVKLVVTKQAKARDKGANVMLIIGCDFHPGFQQVAIFDNRTGEIEEKQLKHRAEAEQFYRSLAGQQVRVGMEACGHYPWFERLLAELGLGAVAGRCQSDSGQRSAQAENRPAGRGACSCICCSKDRFPKIWVPSLEERDVRQLLVHRHKQVQGRTRVKNQLQAMALSQGVQRKRKLWTQGWGGRSWKSWSCCPTQRSGGNSCCSTLDRLEAEIAELNRRVEDGSGSGGRRRGGCRRIREWGR